MNDHREAIVLEVSGVHWASSKAIAESVLSRRACSATGPESCAAPWAAAPPGLASPEDSDRRLAANPVFEQRPSDAGERSRAVGRRVAG